MIHVGIVGAGKGGTAVLRVIHLLILQNVMFKIRVRC